MWPRLTARRLRLAFTSGFSLLAAQVVAPGKVGAAMREEVFLHFIDDATCDLALTATTPTAQEQRSVASLTRPDHRLILQVNHSDAPFVLGRDAESCVIPLLIAFYKGTGKDVIRLFLFRYDDKRQFLF